MDEIAALFVGCVIGLFVVLCVYIAVPKTESDAMKVCELSHSHDVCFQALNR